MVCFRWPDTQAKRIKHQVSEIKNSHKQVVPPSSTLKNDQENGRALSQVGGKCPIMNLRVDRSLNSSTKNGLLGFRSRN